MTQWIKLSEQRPRQYAEVDILAYETRLINMTLIENSFHPFRADTIILWEKVDFDSVTHWMYSPEPPEEE